MSPDAQVLVVGGGPAGSATALHLARAGVEVVLVERAEFPKEKCCGEGIMPHGVACLERLGLGPALADLPSWRFSGITYSHRSREVSGRFPGGEQGLGIRRRVLDALLHQAAVDEPGVRVYRDLVDEVSVGVGGVSARCGERTLHADVLVGADGLNSRVRTQRGLAAARDGRARFGGNYHVSLPPGADQFDTVRVCFARDYELYVTPVAPREVCVAVLCERSVARTLRGDKLGGLQRLAEDCPDFPDALRGAPTLSEGFFCGPLRQTVPTVVADRTALVGDAAGFLDPITGEGLSVALLSAELLAGVLVEALARGELSAEALQPYDDARRQGIRDALLLTEAILMWVRAPLLPAYVMRNLARRPQVFEKLLGVAAGSAPLGSLGASDLRALALP